MCEKVLFRLRESKVSAMNKISATSDSPFTFEREEGRGVFMVCQKNWSLKFIVLIICAVS